MIATWIVLAATAPGIPIVWDEGEYMSRSLRIIEWIRLGAPALTDSAIQSHWLFTTVGEGHPAWFAVPIAFGQWLATGLAGPLTAARLGPITIFSVGCAAVAARLKRDYGMAAAIAAPVALLTFPRLFSEAHFATQDGQLTAWWLMLWAIDVSPMPRARAIGMGVILGLTTATKFTGWFAWVPAVASRQRLLIILPVALLTFYVVNPPLWHHPIDGFIAHIQRNLGRAHSLNVSTHFLRHTHDMYHPLPWYNTLVWLLFVTPVPTLLLGLVGLGHCVAARTRTSIVLILHWVMLMVIRALPQAPPHDGIRLFLPAFGFWCVFAAIGAHIVWTAVKTSSTAARVIVRAALIAAALAGAADVGQYYPQTLSYYSPLVGGVRGAARRGMEPAYWWDALDNDVLAWLNERTEPGATIAFSSAGNLKLLRDWNRLRPETVEPASGEFKWYVLQNRPGMFTDTDRALVRYERPAFAKYAGRRPQGAAVPGNLDVPLIFVFSLEQYQRTSRVGIPAVLLRQVPDLPIRDRAVLVHVVRGIARCFHVSDVCGRTGRHGPDGSAEGRGDQRARRADSELPPPRRLVGSPDAGNTVGPGRSGQAEDRQPSGLCRTRHQPRWNLWLEAGARAGEGLSDIRALGRFGRWQSVQPRRDHV
jgi:hypothetical protein